MGSVKEARLGYFLPLSSFPILYCQLQHPRLASAEATGGNLPCIVAAKKLHCKLLMAAGTVSRFGDEFVFKDVFGSHTYWGLKPTDMCIQ
jgi:hypothetical protein